MSSETAAEKALRILDTEKHSEHGHYRDNFERAAKIANSILEPSVRILPEDIPIILLALKLARSQNAPGNKDNMTDAIGYLMLYSRMLGV